MNLFITHSKIAAISSFPEIFTIAKRVLGFDPTRKPLYFELNKFKLAEYGKIIAKPVDYDP